MSQVYARALALLVLLLVLVLGCGGADDEAEAEQPRQTNGAAGFSTYEVASAGFSIGIPSDWETVSADDVLDEGAVESMIEDNPELEPFIAAISGPDSLIEFIAVDPDVVQGFATNLNVVVEPVPQGLTEEQYFAATVGGIERVLNPTTAVAEEEVTLPAGEALVLRYGQRAEGTPITTLQYMLFRERVGYVLTYTTLPSRADEYADTFERSARSFRIG